MVLGVPAKGRKGRKSVGRKPSRNGNRIVGHTGGRIVDTNGTGILYANLPGTGHSAGENVNSPHVTGKVCPGEVSRCDGVGNPNPTTGFVCHASQATGREKGIENASHGGILRLCLSYRLNPTPPCSLDCKSNVKRML